MSVAIEIEVIGRNGYRYPAVHVINDLFIVGKFIVRVEDGECKDTICKATKANVKSMAAR
jgi:hypothetical protein